MEFNYQYYKVVKCGFIKPGAACKEVRLIAVAYEPLNVYLPRNIQEFVVLNNDFMLRLSADPALGELDVIQTWGVLMENVTMYFCPFQPSLSRSGYLWSIDKPYAIAIEIKVSLFLLADRSRVPQLYPNFLTEIYATAIMQPKEPASGGYLCLSERPCNNCIHKTSRSHGKQSCIEHCALRNYPLNEGKISDYVKKMLECCCSQIKLFIDGRIFPIKVTQALT